MVGGGHSRNPPRGTTYMQPDQAGFRTRAGIPLTIRPIEAADDWQGQGVGTELLDRLTKRAREEGIEAFTATCLMDNSGMLDVFRALPGATCAVTEPLAGVVEVRLALGPAGDDLAKVIRVGSGAFAGAHHPAVPE